MANLKYAVLDPKGAIKHIDNTFESCLKWITDGFTDYDNPAYIPVEDVTDLGVIRVTIAKIQRKPQFKILKSVVVDIYDENKMKEVLNNGGSEDNSCDHLFEEW